MCQPRLIAVDTNVLIDLAKPVDSVVRCLRTIRSGRGGFQVVVTPTVIHELMYLGERGATKEERDCATRALRSLRADWGFSPCNCVPVGHGIVEEIGRKLRAKGLLPEEEKNDSFVLAEAALVGAFALLTSDSHLSRMDVSLVKAVLEDCDVSVPIVCSPWKISGITLPPVSRRR